MNVARAILCSAILLFSVSMPVPARAASDCGFKVSYAELVAIGTAHREALYLISVFPENWANGHTRFPSGFHFTAGTDAGATVALGTQLAAPPPDNDWHAAMLLAVLPSPGIRSFRFDSITTDANTTTCAPNDMYVLPQALYSTDGTFDDSAFALGSLPLVMPFQPPAWTHKAWPNYPDAAKENNLQGDVTVAVTIDAAGKAADAALVTSSGYRLLDDAALAAARASGFGPLVMPAALGIKPMAIRFVIVYTFSLDV